MQHRCIAPEHLILAIVAGRSGAGHALRACGVDGDALRRKMAPLSKIYTSSARLEGLGPSELVIRPTAMELVARAEGLAMAQGRSSVRPDDLVVALLWDPGTPLVLKLLAQLGATRERVVDALTREGIATPNVPLPDEPAWGAPRTVSTRDFQRIAADLRLRGIRFRCNVKGDRAVISIEGSDSDAGERHTGSDDV